MTKSLAAITVELAKGVKTQIVDAADISFVTPPKFALGSLTAEVQQTMMAQRVKSVNQPSDGYSIDQGIGLLGINMQQLIDAELIDTNILPALEGTNNNLSREGIGLVPSTLNLDPQLCYDALLRGTSWNGAYGINALPLLLSNPALQLQIVQNLYVKAYTDLLKIAVITPTSQPAELSLCIGLASIYGVQATTAFLRSKQ